MSTKYDGKAKKSVILPSGTNIEDLEGAEETEITAQISVPTEGGWGWIVVAASFMVIFVLDGVFFTFGSILNNMADDLRVDASLVALANSVAVAVYLMAGPLVSALINRFGFRMISMSGSVICSVALLCTYFATSFPSIIVSYGIFGGLGAAFSSMACGLVVGFYFEKLRAIAMSIASAGSSVGVMVMFAVNSQIVNLAGWRVVMLLHSGLLVTIYFFSMTFRPLLSFTVTTVVAGAVDAEETKTVTYLPSLARLPSSTKPDGQTKNDRLMSTPAERLFSAVSNAHFPTAATMVTENTTSTPTKAGPSTAATSRITFTPQSGKSGISRKQLKDVQSKILSRSKTSVGYAEKHVEINIVADEKPDEKKLKWWQKCCHWEEHISQARPMYRDDAFYEGKLDKLPAYQKSVVDTATTDRTGLEYQMAVSRAVTAAELTEKRGIFTTAVRRILATMLDPKLMKKLSFLLFCSSAFFTYVGFLVPYVFLPDRNKNEGISPEHCNLFVSVIGFANAFGRVAIGTLAMALNPVYLYLVCCLISGTTIIAFNFSFNLYYQYAICLIFGFHIGSLSCVRSVAIVHLYGLEMLTNATGLILMFQGLGSLISTPIAGVLKNTFGYSMSFYVAGTFVFISGIVLIPVEKLNKKEQQTKDAQTNQPEAVSPKKV